MKPDLSSVLPLSAASLHILLSLAADDLHGYGIMQEVLRQSDGKYKLGPGRWGEKTLAELEGEELCEVEEFQDAVRELEQESHSD